MKNIEDILKLMETRPDTEGEKLIDDAYEFAKNAHEGEKRFSGDPYFLHVFETAKNLARIGMGPRVIAAGLLHDTLEDAGVDPQTLKEKFGEEILFLVEGVTKLGKIRYQGVQRYTESLRKLFVAMAQDLRVIIIKLADRLHNMETLQYVPEEKRYRIALETLEIYAPLAYRLGIRKFHRELEDLAFEYVHPKEYQETKQLLRKKSKEGQKYLEKTLKSVKKILAREHITDVEIDYRVKGLYSLYLKLKRKNMNIEEIYDIAAIRIITHTVSDCYAILGMIHGTWKPIPGRIKDYIATEKPNGYQSIHTTVFTGDGGIVEIQIRTREMHQEAEYGVASHFSYKETRKGEKFNTFAWIKSLLPRLPLFSDSEEDETANKTPLNKTQHYRYEDVPRWVKELAEVQVKDSDNDKKGFMDDLTTDFFEARVFIFTPKGDVIDLPIGSSPIDFAYAIHSDIGNHTAGAKVNGKFVAIDTPLKNGDHVEINVKASAHPSNKWLAYVKTALARKQINTYLAQEQKKI